MDTHWQGESPAAGLGDARPPATEPSTQDTAPERQAPQVVASTAALTPQDYRPDRLDQLTWFFQIAAPRPNEDIALLGAIGTLAGVLGRCYNTFTGAGLNQYILMLAPSGLGKDAIDSVQSKLLASVSTQAISMDDGVVVSAGTFRGPEIVSAPGTIKWLEKNPSFAAIVGEFGYLLQRLAGRAPSSNDLAIKQFLLKVYSKSGAGNSYDPLAYSEREKQTKPIASPALTLIAESVPSEVYEAMSEKMASSGFLPRFMVQEIRGERAALNENPAKVPDGELRQWFGDLCAYALQLNHRNQAIAVPADPYATQLLRDFDKWCDAEINAHIDNGVRELWNRAHLKALKLATLRAVANDHLNPLVRLKEARWATDLIAGQTHALIAKFKSGDVGDQAGNQSKQQSEVKRVIREYFAGPFERYEKYGVLPEMHRDLVVTDGYIQRRLITLAPFVQDKAGASRAIKAVIKDFTEQDELREVPKAQMAQRYGCGPRAYVVTRPKVFLGI